ncbi:hypothetical protein AUP68_13689 [Ilyonectria robusta]
MSLPPDDPAAEHTVPPQPQRKRAKHTRSRLGCGVCRIRRIRCDRTRPSCDRCTTTGRKCDGYPATTDDPLEPGANGPGVSRPLLRAQSHALQMSPRELPLSIGSQAGRSLHYFQHNTALEFSGYFNSDLWNTLVLQVSRRETCVQQMVVALGLLHESFHHDHGATRCTSTARALRQQATNEYALGIGLLNSHISTQGWASLEITLLCSLLCVAFEWLRGDYFAAQTHLWSSNSIMAQWYDKKHPQLNATSLSSPSGHMIRTRLRPVSTSLVLQARSMPTSLLLPWNSVFGVQSDIQPFHSLQQARDSLDVLLADALPDTVTDRTTGQIDSERVWDISCRLSQWSQHFENYLSTSDPEELSSPPATIMKLWHTTARILLTATLRDDEGSFDSFLPEFTDTVEKVEGLLSSSSTTFSVDIGVVPLLYYVALKCRHPRVRRQAIKMLVDSPRREAVWDSLGAACVVQEVLEVEERGLGEVCSHLDVPFAARVCNMRAVTDVENRRIRIITMQQGPKIWNEEKVLIW